ncbi:MAG TPA: ParA family protein [Bradyrhizobium sp.]|nr:ParA family protein [Bradyrhizobium sp.]
MRSIISVVQRKGGVGKTTIAISLAGELHRRGLLVDVIDADPQRSAAEWAAPGRLPFRVSELPLRVGGAAQWADIIRSMPGATTIIDTPPHEYAVGAAVAVADVVVLPCTPSGLDLSATEQAIAAIIYARDKRGVDVPALLLPNRVDPRMLEGQQIVEALEELGEIVCAPVASRLAYVRAFSAGVLPTGETVSTELARLGDQVLRAIAPVYSDEDDYLPVETAP